MGPEGKGSFLCCGARCGSAIALARLVYSFPLLYGICFMALGFLDMGLPTFAVICWVLGGVSILVGLLGFYGVAVSSLLALQMSQILFVCETVVFLILTTLLCIEVTSAEPSVLAHKPPPVLAAVIRVKPVGWAVVLLSYGAIAVSLYYCGAITDLISKIESDVYLEQIRRWKRAQSIERLERLYLQEHPGEERSHGKIEESEQDALLKHRAEGASVEEARINLQRQVAHSPASVTVQDAQRNLQDTPIRGHGDAKHEATNDKQSVGSPSGELLSSPSDLFARRDHLQEPNLIPRRELSSPSSEASSRTEIWCGADIDAFHHSPVNNNSPKTFRPSSSGGRADPEDIL